MSMDMETVYRILNGAVQEHQPSALIACFSGGYDSMVMTHIVNQWVMDTRQQAPLLVAAVDTLISADGWRDFVTDSAMAIGSKRFEIWDNPGIDLWEADVRERGFVYRKAQHKFYFYYLKQRVFRQMVQHFKTHEHDRIMFLNGVRRDESPDRANEPEVKRIGCGVYVNPVLYWTQDDINLYRAEYDLPINPFYDRWNNSGDCGCNWHDHISVAALHRWGTKAAKIIDPLRQHNLEVFGYDYDEEPSQLLRQEAAGQQRLFDWDTDCTPNLCAGCSKPEPGNDALDFVSMQRMEW